MTARTLAALLALATTTFGVTASAQDEGTDDDAPTTATTAIPVPAWSATTGADDVVVLRDGGAIRGLLMEVIPNDHASVKLAEADTESGERLKAAEQQAAGIVDTARAAASDAKAKLLKEAEARAAQVAADAEARAKEASAKALRESEKEIARLAVLAAAKAMAEAK